MALKFFPHKFTLKNDGKDGGDQDKSVRLITVLIFSAILITALAAKIIPGGATFKEILGLIVLSSACLFASGLLKIEIVEGERTMYNTIIWLAGALLGLILLTA